MCNQEVCGAVPKSRMFCEPVRRPRPQTTAFTLPPAGQRDMSVVTSAASTSAWDDRSYSSLEESRARPVTTTEQPTASGARARATARHHPPCKKHSPRKQRDVCGSDGIETRSKTERSAGRHRPEHHPPASAARSARVRPPAVGPSSFARAERSTITDECRRKEESYGKQVVRLLTREGDVLVTVTRRRASARGSQNPLGVRAGLTSAAAAAAAAAPAKSRAAAEPRSAAQERKKLPPHDGRREGGRKCSSSGSRNRADGGGEGDNAVSGANSVKGRRDGHVSAKRGSITLEAQAMRLLPEDLAASLTAYREPGRSELPLVFRATSAPIVRAAPNSRAAKVFNRRSVDRADTTGVVHDEAFLEKEKEEEARATRIFCQAEALIATSSGRGGGRGGGGGGGDGMVRTSMIRTRVPAPSDPNVASDFPGGAGTNDGSCEFANSTVWSGGETGATIPKTGED